MSLKEDLKSKINSEAQFRSILEVNGYGTDPGCVVFAGKHHKRQWWASREDMRLQHGIYTVTPPLEALNAIIPIHAHVSIEDPTRVAYTPDKNLGEQDRQLVIGLGKLLTRYYPALQDQVIADFVAAHYADLSDEVEWIEPADISKFYQSGAVGACMSKASDYFKGYDPTEAYNAPNIRLAVLRTADGDASARCLVYNASETDKRYIRVYGDKLLEKRLRRQGYVPGTWYGAKFKTIKVPVSIGGYNSYALPYLDGNGGMGSELKSTVALIDGVIQSVPMEYANNLRRISPTSVVTSMNVSGRVILENADSASFSVEDYITKEQVSKFENLYKLLVDGVLHFTKQDSPLGFVRATSLHAESEIFCYIPLAECTSTEFYGYYATAHLTHFDMVFLDETLYPDERRAFKSSTTVVAETGVRIKCEDAMEITSDTGTVQIHKSELVKTGKNRHIRLLEGRYAMPGTKLYLTPSGRKVHPQVHNVVQLHNGMYEFRRNARPVVVLGKGVWVDKTVPVDYSKGSAIHNDMTGTVLSEFRQQLSLTSFSRAVLHFYTRVSGGNSFRAYGYSYGSSSSSSNVNHSESPALQISTIRRIGMERTDYASKLTVYAAEVAYAEMTAVEAPHYLTPPSTVLVIADDEPVLSEQEAALQEAGVIPLTPRQVSASAVDSLKATLQNVADQVEASGVLNGTSYTWARVASGVATATATATSTLTHHGVTVRSIGY